MTKSYAAASPFAIELKDWRAILVRALPRALSDNVGPAVSLACILPFLSIFPAVATGLMVWGLFTEMTTVGAQLGVVRDIAPEAFTLVAGQMVVIA